jgi:SecD/SecF fusion protein
MPDRRFKPKKRPSRVRNHALLLILLALLMAGSVFMFTPPNEKIRQGLDVQGGFSVVLQAKNLDDSPVSQEDLSTAREIVERRVNLLGASEPTVQVQGTDQILVQIPGLVDQTQALDTIGRTGYLEFVNLKSLPEDNSVVSLVNMGNFISEEQLNEALAFKKVTPEQILNVSADEYIDGRLPSGLYNVLDLSGSSSEFDTESTGTTYYQRVSFAPDDTYEPIFSGKDIESVTVGKQSEASNFYSVNLRLNGSAAQRFATATTELYPSKGKIAIVLDRAVQSAPAVQNAITDGNVSITGDYTIEDAKSLQTILQSGSLPVTLNPINAQVVGPTLGQESLYSGVLVALIGLALVALYLLFFYRGIGLLTACAIAVFAVLYLGILATLSYFGQFSLSLAGIAGIVLAIGVAADSSILVLERFKEEIRMGRSVRASSVTGVRHAIVTSIDADFVTLVSALALFFIAVGSVKGFGLTLALGVVCDILTMLLFKAPLIRLLAPRVIARNPGFWGVKEDEEFAHAAGELNRGVANG